MLSYRLGTVNDFHWGFKPVLSYSKPHTFSTFLEKKKKEKVHLISPTILNILQCKKKNRRTLMSMYDQIHYIKLKNFNYLEDTRD